MSATAPARKRAPPRAPVKRTRAATPPHAGAPASQPALPSLPGAAPVIAVARQLRSWADALLGMAGPATDMAFNLAKSQVKSPTSKAMIEKAGAQLRRMRETAGLSASDLAQALNLTDPALIEQAEVGKVALPFELLLRLAAVLGRNDPFTAVMRLTRAYYPELWKSLEALGVGRLVVQAGRERELANLLRANDAARKLSDADFAQVLAFTRQAFELAVAFRFAGRK
jgi:transcriptional regulator with XRE-family HTH domain